MLGAACGRRCSAGPVSVPGSKMSSIRRAVTVRVRMTARAWGFGPTVPGCLPVLGMAAGGVRQVTMAGLGPVATAGAPEVATAGDRRATMAAVRRVTTRPGPPELRMPTAEVPGEMLVRGRLERTRPTAGTRARPPEQPTGRATAGDRPMRPYLTMPQIGRAATHPGEKTAPLGIRRRTLVPPVNLKLGQATAVRDRSMAHPRVPITLPHSLIRPVPEPSGQELRQRRMPCAEQAPMA
ncbi:hypothetical protein NONI108955_27390 [Nocardia ninae]